MGRHRSRALAALLGLAASLGPVAQAAAETRAWLDRDSVGVGETVTLNIETDQRSAEPDYAPLQGAFGLSAQTGSRQMQVSNGTVSIRSLFGVALSPRRAGEMTIPALRVGNELTAPLRLSVGTAAAATPAPGPTAQGRDAQGSEAAFVETVVDDPRPYVQQSVGVVVRLYFSTQLASGQLDLDTPDGASLQRIGDDVNSVKAVNGRQYNVVERRFLLVPERSGPLQLPGARFSGRAVGGFFDDYFGRGNGELDARSASTTLQVRAMPAGAPQPWLPLRNLSLRYTATPQRAVAGEAAQIVVEATATGATQAQFPELPTPSVPDAQVFAEPPQADDRFVGGSPQLRLTRRYSVVPNRAGPLVVPGLQVQWWDVGAGAVRSATLPDVTLQVAPGSGSFAAPASTAAASPARAPAAAADPALALPARARWPWPWIAAAAVFALLWLGTLAWALGRRRPLRPASDGAPPAAAARGPGPARQGMAELRRALDTGGFDEVAQALCGLAGVGDLDAVVGRLDDPAQREAVLQMQRARWGGAGDGPAARAALRTAFAGGPRWRTVVAAPAPELPPLYPRAPQ